MKQYPNAIKKLFYEPLLITQARHAAICRVLEARMAGQMPNPVDDDDEDEDEEDGDYEFNGRDMIIRVHGVLVGHASDIPMSSCGCGLDQVSEKIDFALGKRKVQNIIFDFNTPGGSVTGIPELGRKIAGIASKATIAFCDSECCSGGLWLAAQCQQFLATTSASIGSIGVWTAYTDLSRQMAMQGESVQAISAGKYKLMGAYWKPLSDEEKKMLQDDVDKIYGQFKEAVNTRRQVDDEFMQGQIFDGETAREVGIVDELVEGLQEILSGD